jgi:tRNA (cmo5U34)-methyltransferase
MLLTLLTQHQPQGLRLLDLGCGDGIVSEMVLTRLPGSVIAGLDSSKPMLAAAEARLSAYPGRYALYERGMDDSTPLPDRVPFDAAIGVQSIHHLTSAGKAALFRWVAGHLRPGGLLLLSDRIRLTSAALFPYIQALHDFAQQELGGPLAPAGFGYAAHLRAAERRGDLPDTVEDQLAWMQDAGFGEVTCFYRLNERAIFGGLLQPPGPPDTPAAADQSGDLITDANAAAGALKGAF